MHQQASPLNTYIMRLADVYLIKAEAILGNKEQCSDAEGLAAFNEVRSRAGVKTIQELRGRNYYTFSDLIRERRIEFCMEYQNWFDMVTWYRWKPQEMLTYFNYQQYADISSTMVRMILSRMRTAPSVINAITEHVTLLGITILRMMQMEMREQPILMMQNATSTQTTISRWFVARMALVSVMIILS